MTNEQIMTNYGVARNGGQKNCENVSHEESCPWIRAVKLFR